MTPSTIAEGGRRERKREQTANHLAATAFRLFEAHGYDAVAMEQIAAQADVAKGTLYNYFPVKEALLAHHFRQEIAAGMTVLASTLSRQPDFRARMTALLQASARWNRSRRPYMARYLRYRLSEIGAAPRPDADGQRSGVHSILEALFHSGQQRGELRTDLSPCDLAWLFEFMTAGAVIVWLRQPEDDDLEARMLFALDVLLDGACADAAASLPAEHR
jgi:AcrR family transcriptional regulator